MHGSHQAVGGDDMMQPGSAMGRQGSGYRVVETPSVLTAGMTGRHSSSGQGLGSAFDAAAHAAPAGAHAHGGLSPQQQAPQQQREQALARMASGEMGAVQALSGLHAANAVLAAAGAAAGLHHHQQQQQSHAARLFDEAVNTYGGGRISSGSGLPPGPSAISAVAGRVSDPNTGASSSTATPPSGITAGGQLGHAGTPSPLGTGQAALSRLNSSEVRAVQALSGIHNDVLPYQHHHHHAGAVGGAGAAGVMGRNSWAGFGGQHQRQQQMQHQQQGYALASAGSAPLASPASFTEHVAKELLCRAPQVSAVASSSIAAVAAAAAAAAAAKSSSGGHAESASAATAAGRMSADGSFSGLVGEMAAGLGDSRVRVATPPTTINPERLSTPGLSPLLTSNMLLPPPPPLQLQLDGAHDMVDSLPPSASAAAAAVAAAGAAASAKAAAPVAVEAAAGKLLPHIEPGDALAAEAGWGSGLDDLLMPKKRPSCSGNSGLIGLLENIGQLHAADAAASAVAAPQESAQQHQQQQELKAEAGDAPAAKEAELLEPSQEQEAVAPAPTAASKPEAAPAATVVVKAEAATPACPSPPAASAVRCNAASPVAAAAAAAAAAAQTMSAAPVAFMTAAAVEPMAVAP